MIRYIRHDAAAYETDTTPFLLKHGKGDDDGYNDVMQTVEKRIQEMLDSIYCAEDKNIKKIIKILFTDVNPDSDYDNTVADIADVIAETVLADMKDMLS